MNSALHNNINLSYLTRVEYGMEMMMFIFEGDRCGGEDLRRVGSRGPDPTEGSALFVSGDYKLSRNF
jgi:hypothetical protein